MEIVVFSPQTESPKQKNNFGKISFKIAFAICIKYTKLQKIGEKTRNELKIFIYEDPV